MADLVQSVHVVEQDPYRYGVELDEVERRRKLVEEVGGELEDMREELNKKIHDSKGKGIANGDSMLPDPDSFAEPDDYAAFEQERQMEMMNEQDEALDGVFQTVGSLRQQADAMGQELGEQHAMLEDVETITDRVGGKLQVGMKKIGWVIKENEGQYSHCRHLAFDLLIPSQKPCPAAALEFSSWFLSFSWLSYWSYEGSLQIVPQHLYNF